MLVFGGGYVGLEFAQAMRRLGSKVTVIERNDRIIHSEDDDVTDALLEFWELSGPECVDLTKLGRSAQSVSVAVEKAVRDNGCLNR